MPNTGSSKQNLVNLIYETAEDIELCPKLLDACQESLLEEPHRLTNKHENPSFSDLSPAPENPNKSDELARHLMRAIRINHRYDSLKEEVGNTSKILDHLPVGVITITKNGDLIRQNTLAEKVIASSSLLRLEQGRLSAHSLKAQAELHAILKAALENKTQHDCTLKLSNRDGTEIISIYAVGAAQSSSDRCCTLFIAANSWSQYISSEALRNIHKLTPAETRLTLKLVAGDTLAVAAENLNISQNTARNQLKSVFAKTQTRRQAELVALILSTPTSFHHPPEFPSRSQGDPPGQITPELSTFSLDDGRVLKYSQHGDPNGKAVVYCHDTAAWTWWDLLDDSSLKTLGVRLIVPRRPGFCGTDFHSKASLLSFASDLEQLLDHLIINDFYLLGFSSGGPFAAACAHRMRHRCLALSLVSSSAPVADSSELEDAKPAMTKMLLGFAKHSPRLYRRFIRILLPTVIANPKIYIKNYISKWSNYDKTLLQQSTVAKSVSDCFRSVVSEGTEGIIHDPILVVSPWGFGVEELLVPCNIWRGADDCAIPPQLVKKLSSIAAARYCVVEGCGHMLIYENALEIFSTLLETNTELTTA